jgi:hypothetical protein
VEMELHVNHVLMDIILTLIFVNNVLEILILLLVVNLVQIHKVV